MINKCEHGPDCKNCPTETQTKPTTEQGKSKVLWVVIIGFAVLVLAAFVTGAVYGVSTYVRSMIADNTEEIVPEVPFSGTISTPDMVPTETGTFTEEELQMLAEMSQGLTLVEGNETLKIDWIPAKSQKRSEKIDPILYQTFITPCEEDEWCSSDESDMADESQFSYVLGTVKGGRYDGYVLSTQEVPLMGMGVYYLCFYVLTDPTGVNQSVILDRYSDSLGFGGTTKYASARWTIGRADLSKIGDKIIFDTTTKLSELEYDSVVEDTQGRKFVIKSIGAHWQNEDSLLAEPAGKLTNGTPLFIDKDESGQSYNFYIIGADGRKVNYFFEIPFWPNTLSVVDTPSITWADGTVNTQTYNRGLSGGCAMSNFNIVVNIKDSELVKGGTFADRNGKIGEIFVPATFDKKYYQDMFKLLPSWEDSITWEEFTTQRPVFYYKDDFGRLLEFRNSSIMPAAECGKPVIYLYPEEKTNIDVQLEPQGGFTYTEPVYQNGWHVTAYPDGQLVNLDDGQTYPYLFWEGRGGLYSEPQNYWVVAQADVHDFLIEKLAVLGLNDKETADFMEFWEPRMQSAAYYKIGFHGTQVMNIIAPMKLSISPDTMIRILMDYQELDSPIAENPPHLMPAPEREGFTVIEWGGVIE